MIDVVRHDPLISRKDRGYRVVLIVLIFTELTFKSHIRFANNITSQQFTRRTCPLKQPHLQYGFQYGLTCLIRLEFGY